MEYLEGVKSLGDSEWYTQVEITTNKGVYRCRLPFTLKQMYNNKSEIFNKQYSFTVRDFCRTREIRTKEYFNFIHKNLE
jgi:hypothetical protein